jgi:predicted O-methyltransferase YrrM
MVDKRYSPRTSSPSKRVFDYSRELLPHPLLSEQEEGIRDIDAAVKKTGLSIGYPAWNLLYYSLFCSLPEIDQEAVIVETGTNLGYSTIVLAQALSDARANGCVYTVDIDETNIELAKKNVEMAGLTKYVKFHTGNAVTFLKNFVREKKYINFVFLDDLHEYGHVKKEFSIIYPKIVACGGKVYFDNTSQGSVRRALRFIRKAYPGNVVEFKNCSWNPPGNAIWQPY